MNLKIYNFGVHGAFMVIEYLTAILAFITAIYAYLTHRMARASEASVEAMHAQNDALTRPYITVTPFVRKHTPLLYLRIENSGRTAAENVRLTLDRDFFQFGEKNKPMKNLRNMSAFQNTIDSMPPSLKLNFVLGQAWVIFGKNADSTATPNRFVVTVKYEYSDKSVEEAHQVDLRPYLKTEVERDPVVEELEKIRKTLEGKK